jgi:hypothetical protein
MSIGTPLNGRYFMNCKWPERSCDGAGVFESAGFKLQVSCELNSYPNRRAPVDDESRTGSISPLPFARQRLFAKFL